MKRSSAPSALSILALVAVLTVACVATAPAGAAPDQVASAAAKKKKCGKKKKGKKAGASAKCKKKKGGAGGGATGPEIALGDYLCDYGSFQVQAGNRYTVNRSDPGAYTYNPSLGIVNFKGGSYSFMFGKYDPDTKVLDLYSNDASVTPVGTYAWSCSKL